MRTVGRMQVGIGIFHKAQRGIELFASTGNIICRRINLQQGVRMLLQKCFDRLGTNSLSPKGRKDGKMFDVAQLVYLYDTFFVNGM